MKKYKWCIHCKEFHLICYTIWEFRKNTSNEEVPYRCKIARRKRYPDKEKEKMATYYQSMPEHKKKFVNERKRLRKAYNNDKLSDEEFNKLLEEAYTNYKGACDEKINGAKSSGKGVSTNRGNRGRNKPN